MRAARTTYRFCASGGVEIISTGRSAGAAPTPQAFWQVVRRTKNKGRSELLFTIMMSRRGGQEKPHSPELVIFRTA